VIDWDGDGDLDLLSGSSKGGVQWAENRAGPGKSPQLQPFRMLIKPGPHTESGTIAREADLKGPSGCTRVWVDDYNSDGKLDILVGDRMSIGLAGRLTNRTQGSTGLTQLIALFARSIGNSAEGAQEDTGFVWVYLQK
jgi:hypothetical protein